MRVLLLLEALTGLEKTGFGHTAFLQGSDGLISMAFLGTHSGTDPLLGFSKQ